MDEVNVSPSTEKYFEGKISVREFLVDFFGALMPGVFFLIFLGTSFILPVIVGIHCLYCLLSNCHSDYSIFMSSSDLSFISQIPIVFDIVIFFLFLAFGYIIGTLFYRRDPKQPDYKSFLAITDNFTETDELENWVVKSKNKKTNTENVEKEKEKNELTVPEKEVQFPYNNLKGYLLTRGWSELADKINWDFNQKTNIEKVYVHHRSKTFINALKIRLQFYFPEHCSTIIKNEAHIRLSSSMWYVSLSLIKFSLYGLSVAIFFSIFIFIYSKEVFDNNLFFLMIIIALSTATWILALKIKSSIEKFFHYQRVREIFYVLETAVTAAKSIKDGDQLLFRGMVNPKNNEAPKS